MSNQVLFIKRAEENQTKEFITEAFASNHIGKVSEVSFIQKYTDSGKPYNGVIVNFESFNNSPVVIHLFNEMTASRDGTTRFYFSKNRYWIINVHKPKYQELAQEMVQMYTQNPIYNQEPQDKIQELETLVQTLTYELNYSRHQTHQVSKKLEQIDNENTYKQIQLVELESQIEEKDRTERELLKRIKDLELANSRLIFDLELTKRELEDTEDECDSLKQEIKEEICMRKYIEEQVDDLVGMIRDVNEFDPVKKIMEEYIISYIK